MVSTTQFKKKIWDFYKENGRAFPWRRTRDPYRILVSEIMLQQTQTSRVLVKYEEWLKEFPTFESLAYSSFQKVLRIWQGLGYNRRALALKRTAEYVTQTCEGVFPNDLESILALPGIGPYTAGAIMAFAYNKPVPIIETNIRTVYIHFFFKNKTKIDDKKLLPLVAKTLDEKNPREWYYALMDYGVMLKKKHGNFNKHSKHYVKQSKFTGSERQIRSHIVKIVIEKSVLLKNVQGELKKYKINATKDRIIRNVNSLIKDGLIKQQGKSIVINH